MTIGFVGLGQMGKPMALNLTKSPGTYIVYARRSDHFAEFADRGVRATTRAADLADVNVLFLSLPSTSAVNEVLFGYDGIAKRLQPGTLVVDTSTVSYGATVEIGKNSSGHANLVHRCAGVRHAGPGRRRHAHHYVRWK